MKRSAAANKKESSNSKSKKPCPMPSSNCKEHESDENAAAHGDEDDDCTISEETSSSLTAAERNKQREIKDSLKSKKNNPKYKLIPRKKMSKAGCWKHIGDVLDRDDKCVPYVACFKCKTAFFYPSDGSHGTTHLNRHVTACQKQTPEGRGPLDQFMIKQDIPKWAKDKMIEACVALCVKDLRPFTVVEGEGFQNLIDTVLQIGNQLGVVSAKDLVPHPTTISRHAQQTHREEKAKLKTKITPTFESVGGGATTDMWTADVTKTKFTGLTGHYITSNFDYNDHVLATSAFPYDSATGEAIAEEVLRLLDEFDLSQHKDNIVVVTDHASNVVNGMEQHAGITRLTCAAHRLNTVLESTFNRVYTKVNPDLPVEVADLFDGCRSLVTYFKQAALMPKLKVSLKQQVETRWLSRLQMLESILDGYADVKKVLTDYRREELPRLTNLNKRLLSEMVDFLKPFNRAIEALEASKKPTIHKVVPYWMKLKNHCKDDLNKDSPIMAAVKMRANAILDKKQELKDTHLCATVLHPKHRSMKSYPQGANEADVYNTLEKMMLKFQHLCDQQQQEQNAKSDQSDSDSDAQDDSFLNDSDDEDSGAKEKGDSEGVRAELDRYLDAKFDQKTLKMEILHFWKQHSVFYPRLSLVARSLLAVPASSAPSERDFSAAGFTLNQRRAMLSADSVDAILFLKSNMTVGE